MRVRIQGEGGIEEVELDFNLDNLTMREAVRLEESLGGETWDRLIAGSLSDTELFRPRVIQAILYTKLKSLRPDLELDQFDIDLEEIMDSIVETEEEDSPKVEEPSSA